VRNEVLHRVKEDRNTLHTLKIRKANWIDHILHRNCLLKHADEGMIEVTGRQGKRPKHLLDDLKETRGYWK
jgi:hypothetical protein